MIIDPKLYPRILALPLAFRRLLAESEGPGWWIKPDGKPLGLVGLYEKSGYVYYVPSRLEDGMAFLPSDPTVWLKAACGYVGASWWSISPDDIGIGWEDGRDRYGAEVVALVCDVVEEYERRMEQESNDALMAEANEQDFYGREP